MLQSSVFWSIIPILLHFHRTCLNAFVYQFRSAFRPVAPAFRPVASGRIQKCDGTENKYTSYIFFKNRGVAIWMTGTWWDTNKLILYRIWANRLQFFIWKTKLFCLKVPKNRILHQKCWFLTEKSKICVIFLKSKKWYIVQYFYPSNKFYFIFLVFVENEFLEISVPSHQEGAFSFQTSVVREI